jgi:hypothetical protein
MDALGQYLARKSGGQMRQIGNGSTQELIQCGSKKPPLRRNQVFMLVGKLFNKAMLPE